jgi:hypothetical protein
VSDLEEQKRNWGREGHGIPGANPNYAGRVRILAVAGVLILGGGVFVFLTGGHTQTKTAARYIADVKKDDSVQPQLDVSLHHHPAKSEAIVHDLIETLQREDRRLSSQHWPTHLEGDIQALVSYNQQQVAVLEKYASASPSERPALLKQQNNDAYQSEFYDSQIRSAIDANPVGS